MSWPGKRREGKVWGRKPICNWTVKRFSGLQEIEMFGAFKRCYLREQLQWRWQASLPREEPSGRETEGSYRSPDLLCMWAGSHKCSTVLYIPLTCMKWLYGRRRLKTFFLESARRSELRPAPWCSKWLGARRSRAALDAAVVWFSVTPFSSVRSAATSARISTGSQRSRGTDVVSLTPEVYSKWPFFAVIKRLLALLNWHINMIKDDFIKVRVGDHFKSFWKRRLLLVYRFYTLSTNSHYYSWLSSAVLLSSEGCWFNSHVEVSWSKIPRIPQTAPAATAISVWLYESL